MKKFFVMVLAAVAATYGNVSFAEDSASPLSSFYEDENVRVIKVGPDAPAKIQEQNYDYGIQGLRCAGAPCPDPYARPLYPHHRVHHHYDHRVPKHAFKYWKHKPGAHWEKGLPHHPGKRYFDEKRRLHRLLH